MRKSITTEDKKFDVWFDADCKCIKIVLFTSKLFPMDIRDLIKN